jgi:peptide/nickel transport system permease protein
MRRFFPLLLSSIWLFIVILASIAAPVISDSDPLQPVASPLSTPIQHIPFGTDALGRDIWTRMLYGGRLSPAAAFLATMITVVVGMGAGLVATSFSGWTDRVIVWLANSMLAIPGLLLAMLLVAAMGPGLHTVILAVGIGGIPGFTRLARTLFMGLRERDYITASEALGGGRSWIAIHHLIPNALRQLISLATTHYAWAFMGTTTLTFLGLAGDPSIPEWGVMLNAGRAHLIDAPWLALFPGLAISFTIMAVHSIGARLSSSNNVP